MSPLLRLQVARAGRRWRGSLIRATAASLVALVLGTACGAAASAPGPASGDTGLLRTADARCESAEVHVPSEAPSEFVVEHQGNAAVVVTIPRQAISVRVEPGGREVVPLNPHLAGEFDYYCITDALHLDLGGHEGPGLLACPLDPGSLMAAGASQGTLYLERHTEP